jgi:hypothetical protein
MCNGARELRGKGEGVITSKESSKINSNERFSRPVNPTFCMSPAYTFVSATFLAISSTPESPWSPPSLLAAAAKLSAGRTLGLRFRCNGGVGWAFTVGLGCADPGSTDPLLGVPRSEPVRELVRDIECCWFSFSFPFSIRSETSASLAETSTGLKIKDQWVAK